MPGYSTFAVLCILCIVSTGVYPFSMPFSKTSFFAGLTDKVKAEEANHMDSTTPTSSNTTLSLKSVFESFIGQKELVVYTILPAVAFGANLAVLGSTAQSVYYMGGTGYKIIVLTITSIGSVVTFAFKEKLSNITTQSKTYIEKIWDIFKTEEMIIKPPPEDSNYFNTLKRNFPWTFVKGNTLKVKELVETPLEKAGPNCSRIIFASLYIFATVMVISFIYESFKEGGLFAEPIRKVWTAEEILEEYKDNKDLYECLEELLTPDRHRRYGEWNYDLSEDSDDSYNQHPVVFSQY